MIVLGIDGGGSKTTAVMVREDGEVLAQAVGGSINYYSNPLRQARRNLQDLLAQVLSDIPTDALQSVFIGMSALNGPATPDELRSFTDGIVSAPHIGMDSDLFVALESMHQSGACAVAVCGTGSMVIGRKPDGACVCRGGFGYLLGDEGSGYAIALEAVQTAVRAAQQIVPPTALTKAALDFFGAQDVDGLIPRFYDPPIRRQDVAAFLPQVVSCADAGDAAAIRILHRQADSFAETAAALLRELPDGSPLGLWGGVFCHVPTFTARFLSRIPATPASILEFPPQIGAVFAAWKACGLEPTAERLARIRATMHLTEST